MNAPRYLACILMLVLCIGPCMAGNGEPSDVENKIKVAYIFKFADYVDWPASSAAPANAPLLIGVVGSDRLVEQLRAASGAHQMKSRQVQVRVLKAGDPLTGLQMLYVGSQAGGRGRTWVENAAAQAILTITDSPELFAAGCVFGFLLVDERVRFEVSLHRAEASGLKVSSRLLAVAYKINGKLP